MAGFNPLPAFGLRADSPNEEKRRKAFEFVKDIGYMIVSTISTDGKTPSARGLELHILDDSEKFYIGMGKGKPVFYELEKNPYVTGCVTRMTDKDLALCVRLSGHVSLVNPKENPEIYNRYWELNPGTKALYKKDLDMFRIFCLDAGDGEIFHLPDADEISRVRFFFGEGKPRPWAYRITENCVGCGVCEQECMRGIIHKTDRGNYEIDYQGCLECGRCYMKCPNRAIVCSCLEGEEK